MNGNHGWQDSLVDATLAGLGAFLGALVAAQASGYPPTANIVYGALLGLGMAFVLSLTAARQRKEAPDAEGPPDGPA